MVTYWYSEPAYTRARFSWLKDFNGEAKRKIVGSASASYRRKHLKSILHFAQAQHGPVVPPSQNLFEVNYSKNETMTVRINDSFILFTILMLLSASRVSSLQAPPYEDGPVAACGGECLDSESCENGLLCLKIRWFPALSLSRHGRLHPCYFAATFHWSGQPWVPLFGSVSYPLATQAVPESLFVCVALVCGSSQRRL